MSIAIPVPRLGPLKAEGAQEAWSSCLSGSWPKPGLPTGHLASPTCVLIRINYHSQGNPLLEAGLFSWQFCSVSGKWCGERWAWFSSANAAGMAKKMDLGQSSPWLPRPSPQWVLPWVCWNRWKKWPRTGASLCLRHCHHCRGSSGWHTEQER